ncbi:MAG: PAS domain S-box protein, partial [Alphaproteobacteria bacterium]|nr:PAS domain S-box protein [Alphaproteobacteria bacterium]
MPDDAGTAPHHGIDPPPAASHLLLMVNIARALPQGPQLARFIERSVAALPGVARARAMLAEPGAAAAAPCWEASVPDIEVAVLRTARRQYGCLCIAVVDAAAFARVRADLLNALSLVALDLDRRDTLDRLKRSEASLIRRVEERTAELTAKVEENTTLATIARHTDNAVILTDANRRIEWVNEGFTRITGFTLDEVKGRSPAMLQGPKTDPATIERMRRALDRGDGFEVDIVNYRKNGEDYWMHVEVQPIHDAAGRPVRFMAIEREITQQKWVEELLQAIAQMQSRFIARLAEDRDDRAGGAFADILDRVAALVEAREGFIARLDPIETGEPAHPVLAAATGRDAAGQPAWPAWAGQLVEAVKLTAEPVTIESLDDGTSPTLSSAGAGLPTRMLGLPLCQGDTLVGVAGFAARPSPFDERQIAGLEPVLAAVANCLVTIRSIEAQRRAVDDLRRAKIAAESADRAKSAFLAQMSHELRTPMNGILGFSELLATAGVALGPDKVKDYAQDIHGAGRHLLDIINDILDLTSLESGKRAIHPEPIAMRDVVARLLRPARGEARRAGLTLRASVPR